MKITYRGWPGHFLCSDRCEFHLNTLIEHEDKKVVVSTVGRMKSYRNEGEYDTIGFDRHYETMAFHAKKEGEFWDADVEREFRFYSKCSWPEIEDEWKANKGHLDVVEEIKVLLVEGL